MYTLIRQSDGITRSFPLIAFVEWTEDGTFKKYHETIQVGYSCLLGPRNKFFTWMTTPITEILLDSPEKQEFKTESSTYTLLISEE